LRRENRIDSEKEVFLFPKKKAFRKRKRITKKKPRRKKAQETFL